jgi:hypothetical protein
MTREQRVRAYANHLALRVRGNTGAFKLMERYGERRPIGTYRTVDTLERAIKRYGDRMLRDIMLHSDETRVGWQHEV